MSVAKMRVLKWLSGVTRKEKNEECIHKSQYMSGCNSRKIRKNRWRQLGYILWRE